MHVCACAVIIAGFTKIADDLNRCKYAVHVVVGSCIQVYNVF